MAIEIETPDDGIAEFPDGTSDEVITAALRDAFPAPAQDAPEGLRGASEVDLASTLRPAEIKAIETAKAAGNQKQVDNIIARAVGRASVPEKRGLGARTAGRGEAFLRSGTQGIFGLGDIVAGLGAEAAQKLPGQEDLTLAQNIQAQRGKREALTEQFPITSGVGFGTGALTSGGPFAKILGKAGAALGLTKPAIAGTALGRGAQASAGGAVVGGTAGAVEGGLTDGAGGVIPGAKRGATAGALLGPAAQIVTKLPVLRDIKKITGAIIRRGKAIRDPGAGGFDALARKLGKEVSGDDLRRDFIRFEQIHGRKPSISEIIDPNVGSELRALAAGAASQRGAQAVFEEATEAAALRRPTELRGLIKGERVTTTATKAGQRRSASADKQFKVIRDVEIPTDNNLIDFLSSPDIRGAAAPALRRKIAAAAQDLGDAAPIRDPLNIKDIDDLRQALGKRIGTGADFRFKDLQDQVTEIGTAVEPRFAATIAEFARRSDVVRGLEKGRRVLGKGKTSEFIDEFAAGSPATQAGTRVGARTALADVAGESPAGAVAVARDLAEDPGLAARLRVTLKPGEAERLGEVGRIQARGADVAQRLSPQNVATQEAAQAETIRQAIQGGALSGKGGSPAFLSNFANNLVTRFRISPASAKALAEDVVDPQRTQAVIERLEAIGASVDDINTIFASSAVAANLIAPFGADIEDQQQ